MSYTHLNPPDDLAQCWALMTQPCPDKEENGAVLSSSHVLGFLPSFQCYTPFLHNTCGQLEECFSKNPLMFWK